MQIDEELSILFIAEQMAQEGNKPLSYYAYHLCRAIVYCGDGIVELEMDFGFSTEVVGDGRTITRRDQSEYLNFNNVLAEVGKKPDYHLTIEQKLGLGRVYVKRELFKVWCEKNEYPLPRFWFGHTKGETKKTIDAKAIRALSPKNAAEDDRKKTTINPAVEGCLIMLKNDTSKYSKKQEKRGDTVVTAWLAADWIEENHPSLSEEDAKKLKADIAAALSTKLRNENTVVYRGTPTR